MAVKKPAELDFSDKKFMAIISGQPGLGKTTLALSAPEPFLFDTDNGISRVRSEHRCPTSTVSDYRELLEELTEARRLRRKAKDSLNQLWPVLAWVDKNRGNIKSLEQLLGEVRKAERDAENRIYTPRTKRKEG